MHMSSVLHAAHIDRPHTTTWPSPDFMDAGENRLHKL